MYSNDSELCTCSVYSNDSELHTVLLKRYKRKPTSTQLHYGWLLFRMWPPHNAFDIYHHHKLQCVCVTCALTGFNNRLYIVLLEKSFSIVWKAFQMCLAGHSKWKKWQPHLEDGGNDIMSMLRTGNKSVFRAFSLSLSCLHCQSILILSWTIPMALVYSLESKSVSTYVWIYDL